jgi:hypothetical protein
MIESQKIPLGKATNEHKIMLRKIIWVFGTFVVQ